MIYVPAGWWHCVLNLDTTFALTENFADQTNIVGVIEQIVELRDDGLCFFKNMYMLIIIFIIIISEHENSHMSAAQQLDKISFDKLYIYVFFKNFFFLKKYCS